MTTKNDGGPAFPIVTSLDTDNYRTEPGLTKRELFASMAMQGMIGFAEHVDDLLESEFTAKVSLKYADALLAALEANNDDV